MGPHADYLMRLPREEFDIFKRAYLSWLEGALGTLRIREEHRRGPVTGLDLEGQLGAVVKLLNRKADAPRIASYLARYFSGDQMAVIYTLLDDLIDAGVRNSDVGGYKAGFDAVYKLQLRKTSASDTWIEG
ncbi:MAG: hypothetical protein WCA78_00155 [Rhizomicrobium sp.]